MGAMADYEHVHAKSRTLFTFRTRSSSKIESMHVRNQRRGQCGWASSIHKPYRPLGTPEHIENQKHSRELSKELSRMSKDSRNVGNVAKGMPPSNLEGFPLEGIREKQSAGNYSGGRDPSGARFLSLKAEIKNSNIRRIGCRCGASFKLVLLGQQYPNSKPSKAKTEEHVVATKQLKPGVRFIPPKIPLDRKLAPPLAVRKPKSEGFPGLASASKVMNIKGSGQPEKHEGSGGLGVPLPPLPAVGASNNNSKEEESTPSETQDPSISMRNRLGEFSKIKMVKNDELALQLKNLSDQRLDIYKRKHQTFRTDCHIFSTKRWKLDAEKMKIQSKLDALNMHRWYFNFVQYFDSISRQTPPEKIVLSQVKHVIESGGDYGHGDFQCLVGMLPKRAYKMASILQILNFIRKEIALNDEDYVSYLKKTDITVPSWSLRSTRKNKNRFTKAILAD